MWGVCQNYNFRVVLYERLAIKKKNGIGGSFSSVYCLLGVIKDFLYGDWNLADMKFFISFVASLKFP